MPEYDFEITLTTKATIKSDSIADAVAGLAGLSAALVPYPNRGRTRLTDVTVAAEDVECVAIDGHSLRHPESVCSHCEQELKLVGGVWVSDEEDQPEKCEVNLIEGQKGMVYGPHDPWRTFCCQVCDHEDREDNFVPSDGNTATHLCPACGRADVFPKE